MGHDRNPQDGRIAPGFVFEGRLSGEGRLDVHGELRGDISRFGTLRVHPTGVVQAPAEIHAKQVYVAGTIKGTVDAREKVLVRAGGVIHGDVRAPRFGLAAGGRVEGRVSTPNPRRLGSAARRQER